MALDPVVYDWILFLHIFGVFVLLIAHGVSSGVGFRLAKERNRERVAALLEFSGSSYRVMILGFWWILITGSVLGYAGDWWTMRWFWAAIVTLIVLAGTHDAPRREALQPGPRDRRAPRAAAQEAPPDPAVQHRRGPDRGARPGLADPRRGGRHDRDRVSLVA